MPRRSNGEGAPKGAGRAVLAPENLPFQLHLLVQAMTRRLQKVLDAYDLTPLHWGMLCCLWRGDGLSATEFAEQLSQLGGTITVALNAMERRRLIKRRPDPRDGRAVRVFLSKRGRELERELVPQVGEVIAELFGDFSAPEYERFAAAVKRLRARAEGGWRIEEVALE